MSSLQFPKSSPISKALYEQMTMIARRRNGILSRGINYFVVMYLTGAHVKDFEYGEMTFSLLELKSKTVVRIYKPFSYYREFREFRLPIFDIWEGALWGILFHGFTKQNVTLKPKSFDTLQQSFLAIRKKIDTKIFSTSNGTMLTNSNIRTLRMHSLVRDYGVQPDDLNSMFGYFEKTNKMALRDIYDPKGSQERILACDGVKTINLQDIFINIEVGK